MEIPGGTESRKAHGATNTLFRLMLSTTMELLLAVFVGHHFLILRYLIVSAERIFALREEARTVADNEYDFTPF
jgi:hypothetical protein